MSKGGNDKLPLSERVVASPSRVLRGVCHGVAFHLMGGARMAKKMSSEIEMVLTIFLTRKTYTFVMALSSDTVTLSCQDFREFPLLRRALCETERGIIQKRKKGVWTI